MDRFPDAADAAAADRLLERFTARHGAPSTALVPLLRCLGGNSPYLADLALREGEALVRIVAEGAEAVCDAAIRTLAATAPATAAAPFAAALRRAKRVVALAAAVADIGGRFSLEQVTGTLSRLAETAISLAVDHLLLAAQARGELRLGAAAQTGRSGFVALAMGKLGARALNFSSDVDLILLFDPQAHPYNADALGAIFARLARGLVSLLQARDADGIVFRVDLRLRPDPGSTPPAVALPMALAYYEGQAQTWERAAMIKARPVAGDLLAGHRFLAAIRPFVWRRHLDFAAIDDIAEMKRRMDGHHRAGRPVPQRMADLLGHDVKLGLGGIREVEFCAQTLQLVWGGRDVRVRPPGTLDALHALASAGHLPAADVALLEAAYRLLRRVEHRLQMVDDRQTHALPETAAGFARFATFMGYADPEPFASVLLGHLRAVHGIFADLLAAPAAAAPQAPLAEPALSWLAGGPRALRSARARALLRELLPALSAAIARQPQPDQAWARLDALIHRLPEGVQMFSTLHRNPALLDRLADVLGAAPSLADHLAHVPSALEGLLAPHDVDPAPGAALAGLLAQARAPDEALAIASRLVRAEEFRLAVAELDGRLGADAAGRARTALADAAMAQILPWVMAEHRRRFGRVRGGGMVVVALGKAGGREMMAGSDLDLMLIYDHPEQAGESDGARPIAASQYFARAAQAVAAALTVPTRDGKLYDVDMRLRPSGAKGPVAVSLPAFVRYHAQDAWTWERLALTRARVVAGPRALRRRVQAAIGEALRREPGSIAADTVAMRARLLRELPARGPWDAKLRAGGLIDVEFVAQALQLLHADRGVLHVTTGDALRALARAGALSAADAGLLIDADRTWRSVQGLLRIMLGRAIPGTLTHAVADRVARACGVPAPALAAWLDDMAAAVREVSGRILGPPA